MAVSLLNITRLSSQQLAAVSVITAKPEIMTHIGDGSPYTLRILRDFVRDERTQLTKSFATRKYWTWAIMLDAVTPIGLFALYKLNFTKYLKYFEALDATKVRPKRPTKSKRFTPPHFAQYNLDPSDIYIGTRILLDTTVQGRGYGTRVYELMKAEMADIHYRGKVHMISFVNSDNIGGNKLQSKNGFTHLGEYRTGGPGAVARMVYYWTLLK
jgi:RimJ/RimL family protein N-acetyltransferase